MQDFLDAIIDFFLWLPRQIFSLFADAVIALFESIEAPEFVQNINLSGLDGFAYIFDVFMIDYMISVTLAAYIARFLLRRMPVIG